MKLIIQQHSEAAIYEQLYSQIVNQILNGSLIANECLPSIRFVARELQISVIPVKTAYEMLERNGFMYTIQGKGCFVKEQANVNQQRLQIAENKARELIELAQELGLDQDEIIELINKQYQS